MPKTDASKLIGRTFRLLKDVILWTSNGSTIFLKAKNGPPLEVRMSVPVFPPTMTASYSDAHGGHGALAKGAVLEIISVSGDIDSDLSGNVILLVHGTLVIVDGYFRKNDDGTIEVVPVYGGDSKDVKWSQEIKGVKSEWNLEAFNKIQEHGRELYREENKDRKKKGAPLLAGEDLDLEEYVPKPRK